MNGDEPIATITGQIPTYDVQDRAQPVQGYEITFRTNKGAKGSVFVAKDAYTEENVRKAVREHAAAMDAIHGAQV